MNLNAPARLRAAAARRRDTITIRVCTWRLPETDPSCLDLPAAPAPVGARARSIPHPHRDPRWEGVDRGKAPMLTRTRRLEVARRLILCVDKLVLVEHVRRRTDGRSRKTKRHGVCRF